MTSYRRALPARTPVLAASGLLAGLVLLAACGGSSGGTTTAAAGTGSGSGSSGSVQVGSVKDLAGSGPTLVTTSGKPLYTENGESAAMFACTGDCLKTWPPLTVPKNAKPSFAGVAASRVATTTRSDGATQVTLDGHPLYTFALDSHPAKAAGDGVSDQFGGAMLHWSAATTSGKPAASSSSSSGTKGGGGYGY